MTLTHSGKVVVGNKAKPDENRDINMHQEGLFRSYLDRSHAIHQMQTILEPFSPFNMPLTSQEDCSGKNTQTQPKVIFL